MKKFFVLLMVFVCVPFAAHAALTCSGFPLSNQASAKNAVCYEGNGFAELVIHFNTGESATTDYSDVTNYLNTYLLDVGHVIITGSADRQQYATGDSFKRNTDLSKERAQKAIDLLPDSIKSQCKLDGGETELCSVYMMGEADDLAKSNGATDSNPNARAARIYVIWKDARCNNELKNAAPKYKEALKDCDFVKNDSRAVLIDICDDATAVLRGASVEKLLLFLMNAGQKCKTIEQINNDIGLEVNIAYNKVNAFVNGLGLSVWRDKDGNFNTARLASDSIAAVVLGTAGGIITSKLVKKNQIKKGFEDLNCSVAGQRIAAWGDEFSVGLQ